MEKTLHIPKEIIAKYNQLMQPSDGIVDYEKTDISRYATVDSWTVDFGDGYEVDIKVCSSNYDDPLWCEGVLFFHGSEVGCTDVCDTLDGEYYFCPESDEFIVYVKPEEDESENHI